MHLNSNHFPMEIDSAKMEVSRTLIDKIYGDFCETIHFAKPLPSSRTNELDLVRGVLHILQGSSSSLFYWDDIGSSFRVNVGLYINQLSLTSLHVILNQFMYAATCLKLVEIVVSKVESSLRLTPPTLRAFACAVSVWLKRLRGIALKEEEKIHGTDIVSTPTLLGMANSLSSLCSGAEYLLQVVNGAIPQVFLEPDSSVPAAEMAVHVLDHLYKKLNEVCPVQGGEEEAYLMLLYIFVGSLLPYIEVLDSWLYEGTLDDPFKEMFFYSNKDISIDEAEFWEKSYLLRPIQYQKFDVNLTAATCANDRLSLKTGKKETAGRESISKGKEWSNGDFVACPLFIRDIAKSIVSAGKSLQLIRHVPTLFPTPSTRGDGCANDGLRSSNHGSTLSEFHRGSIAGLALSEVFCVSLAGLIGHGDHISERFCQGDLRNPKIVFSFESHLSKQKLEKVDGESLSDFTCLEKTWFKFLVDTLSGKRLNGSKSKCNEASDLSQTKEENMAVGVVDELPFYRSFFPENPAITLCQTSLSKMRDAWSTLNLSQNFLLPPLNDGALRQAIFGGESGSSFVDKGTNYTFGFHYDDSNLLRSVDDTKLLETLFPFPTLLPSFQENLHLSELLPFQNNSTMPSRVLRWIQSVEPKVTPLPGIIIQECLIVYMKKQVDFIGRHVLSKLMNGWRLMDELGVLRAIYLLGSGDLLQHFLTVMFNKLDRGESWDDEFELNMILQESIGNSADSMLLKSPDLLVVSISKNHGSSDDVQPNAAALFSPPRRSREQRIGIDGLDSLEFTYKVSWPLELIANKEAIKKYNQVMHFLLKVKRAKFVLDKARRWMWKDKGTATISRKQHWLLEQKLLHFVDAFHQYVMDRVYHSAWRELCEGMAAAGSLDEVIEVHEV